ncbi:PulJ/GspJ family protein [Kineococcus sp. SYSU DK004]|uniref:PulJ/GspJ family protein n=1 Tax=Kineococcus sp. SYSU DK004 TaxID=3383125 RepID=UPI003D7D853B
MTRTRPLLSRLVRRSDDSGFTMLAVLVSAFLVMSLLLVGIALAASAMTRSRASQDDRAALTAAQAGLADYISRLNNCETYYLGSASPCATTNPAMGAGNWATLPGTSGADAARYNQQIISTPLDAGSTGVRVQVDGRARGETRRLTVDLARTGFLKYLYYTDYETFSPSNTRRLRAGTSYITGDTSTSFTLSGSGTARSFTIPRNATVTVAQPTEAQVQAGCQRYYYANGATPARSTFPRTVSWTSASGSGSTEAWPTTAQAAPGGTANYTCLTINFSGADTFDGPVHSNDAFSISGPVLFKGDTTTSWKTTGNPWYGAANPSTSGRNPEWATRMDMPSTTDKQKSVAASGGCLYSGPTAIEFLSDGKLRVKSPQSTSSSTGANCGGGTTSYQTVDGPGNGVIYVQAGPTANSCIDEYQKVTGDVTNYDNNNCRAGDAFVRGTVKGQFTVAAEHDVVVTGNVVYNGGTGSSSTDVLGLVGSNNVAVWNPVTAAGTNINPPGDRRIDAAMASVSNSITVFNYGSGTRIGTLIVNGVLIQKFRGPVATGSGTITSTGYSKDYRYDPRLTKLPPPTFIAPVNDPWKVISLSEQRAS